MSRQKSSGTCHFCQNSFEKSKIISHLQECEKRYSAVERLFHLQVESQDNPDYWLHLEVPAATTLADLDFFLRGIWLECCGHLSQFVINHQHYSVSPPAVSFSEEDSPKSMDVSLESLLYPRIVFSYVYDFGASTTLTLQLLDERSGERRDELIFVLAENDPPKIDCGICNNQAASWVCPIHKAEDAGWLCEACSSQHTCTSKILLPVVNSPRVGVCSYTGEE